MSDDDLEGAPLNVWFDSEVDSPDISSVNTTPYMGVNVSSPFATTPQNLAQENEVSSAMDLAPNKGHPAGNVPLKEEGPNKGDDLLNSPIYTPPPKPVHITFFVPPWLGYGWRKRDETRGSRKVYNTIAEKSNQKSQIP